MGATSGVTRNSASTAARASNQLPDLVVRNARVVLPEGVIEGSLVVSDGAVVDVSPASPSSASREIDARGRYVLPGVIDPHTHPGLVAPLEERLPLESRAMAAGGVTTVISYIRRPESYLPVLPQRIALCERTFLQDFTFHLVLYGMAQVAEVARYVRELQVTSFKVYTNVRGRLGREIRMDALPGQKSIDVSTVDFDEHLLYSAFRALAKLGPSVRLNVHCEDSDIISTETSNVVGRGERGLHAWSMARPPEAEAVAIHEVGSLSRQFQVPAYIPHVGSRAGINAITELLRLRTDVVAETCPHYLVLTDASAGEEAKVAPPIRAEEDRLAVLDAVREGVLSTLGSDDIPYRREEKRLEDFWTQNSAFPGSGLMLPVALTAGLSVELVSQITSANVARAFGLAPQKGSLLPGSDADFVIVDMETERPVRARELAGSSDFSVYEGRSLIGWPVLTCSRGRVIFEDGTFPADPGGGRYLARRAR
jgi:dihydropyrimidinase